MSAADVPYPAGYRTCGICRAYMGAFCMSQGATIIDGVVQGGPTKLAAPHRGRKIRRIYL